MQVTEAIGWVESRYVIPVLSVSDDSGVKLSTRVLRALESFQKPIFIDE